MPDFESCIREYNRTHRCGDDTGEVLQIKADEDGCVYVCNLAAGKWQKVCDIVTPRDLPESVRKKLRIAEQAVNDLEETNNG